MYLIKNFHGIWHTALIMWFIWSLKLGSPYTRDHGILESCFGSPFLWKPTYCIRGERNDVQHMLAESQNNQDTCVGSHGAAMSSPFSHVCTMMMFERAGNAECCNKAAFLRANYNHSKL